MYLPLIRYTFFILEFSAIFHEKTPNRAFDDGDTHDWTDKYCGYNTLILHVIFISHRKRIQSYFHDYNVRSCKHIYEEVIT